jgi:uncharacterized membrane protein YagU involved in acid resistance
MDNKRMPENAFKENSKTKYIKNLQRLLVQLRIVKTVSFSTRSKSRRKIAINFINLHEISRIQFIFFFFCFSVDQTLFAAHFVTHSLFSICFGISHDIFSTCFVARSYLMFAFFFSLAL